MGKDDLTNIDLNPTGDNQDTTGATEPLTGEPALWPDKLDTDDKKAHAYKSVLGGFTKVSQQNKELQERINALEQEKGNWQAETNRPTFLPADQGQAATGSGEFDPYDENAVTQRAMEAARRVSYAEAFSREYAKNPAEFQERNAYVQNLIAQNPNRVQTGADLEVLFGEADKMRKNAIRNNVFKGLEQILEREVTDEDKAKFKSMFEVPGGQPPATTQTDTGFMPDTTGSTATGQDTTQQQIVNLDQQIEEAKKAGNATLVTELIFQKRLLE